MNSLKVRLSLNTRTYIIEFLDGDTKQSSCNPLKIYSVCVILSLSLSQTFKHKSRYGTDNVIHTILQTSQKL